MQMRRSVRLGHSVGAVSLRRLLLLLLDDHLFVFDVGQEQGAVVVVGHHFTVGAAHHRHLAPQLRTRPAHGGDSLGRQFHRNTHKQNGREFFIFFFYFFSGDRRARRVACNTRPATGVRPASPASSTCRPVPSDSFAAATLLRAGRPGEETNMAPAPPHWSATHRVTPPIDQSRTSRLPRTRRLPVQHLGHFISRKFT